LKDGFEITIKSMETASITACFVPKNKVFQIPIPETKTQSDSQADYFFVDRKHVTKIAFHIMMHTNV